MFRNIAAFLLLSTAPQLAAQPRLRDPFGAAPFAWLQSPDTGGAIARALRVAPIVTLVRQGGVGVARWNIAGQPFVFVRGATPDSATGAGQGAYFVYEVVREDSVRLVFSAPYREYSGPGPGSTEKATELRACLYMRDAEELGYLVSPPAKARRFARPVFPSDGYYRWMADRHQFVRVSGADAQLRDTCASTSLGAGK